jgi:hypothetical protein
VEIVTERIVAEKRALRWKPVGRQADGGALAIARGYLDVFR